LFLVLGLLSIYPTIFFLKNRKGDDLKSKIEVPNMVILFLRFELLLIIIIPILATLMSLGIGTF
jgi:putative membrane protein